MQITKTEELAAGPQPSSGVSWAVRHAPRQWALLVGFAVVAGGLGAGVGIWVVNGNTSGDRPGAATVLRELELQRLQSQVDGNVATTDKLLAPGFTQVTPDGSLMTKDDFLGLLASGTVDFNTIDVLGDIAVLDYGDAAVLSYDAHMSVTVHGGRDLTHNAWTTVVYEERDGRWQVRSAQTTGVGFLPPGQ